jgi:MerR HTH family regulatory protein
MISMIHDAIMAAVALLFPFALALRATGVDSDSDASRPLLVSDVARILGCSADYVRVLERTKQLHAIRTAGGIRIFDPEDVERFRQKHQHETRSGRPWRG